MWFAPVEEIYRDRFLPEVPDKAWKSKVSQVCAWPDADGSDCARALLFRSKCLSMVESIER